MDSAIQRLNKQGLDRNHENFAKTTLHADGEQRVIY